MKIRAMIQHFHGGTSLVSVPEGPKGLTCRQTLDVVWDKLNADDESNPDSDVIVNSGQPGDIITFVGRCPFAQRHPAVESEGFTTFMTTEFAVRHVADRTTLIDGVRIYDPESRLIGIMTTQPSDDSTEVFDPSASNHLSPSDLNPDDTGTSMVNGELACQCCGDREATIHESSQSFCPTCYEAGAGRDDRDQS